MVKQSNSLQTKYKIKNQFQIFFLYDSQPSIVQKKNIKENSWQDKLCHSREKVINIKQNKRPNLLKMLCTRTEKWIQFDATFCYLKILICWNIMVLNKCINKGSSRRTKTETERDLSRTFRRDGPHQPHNPEINAYIIENFSIFFY